MWKQDDNHPDYDWDFTWTTDGIEWHTRLFETLDECREFAQDMLSANEGNGAYSFFARRFCVANTCDLLDGTVPAASVRVIVNTSTVVCEAEERPVEDGPEEEKAAEISRDGGEELECDFTWTVDGRAHNTRIFRSLSLCREFARSVAEANEGNVRFAFYARRYVQLDSRDFMDPSVDVRDVPLARRVRLA